MTANKKKKKRPGWMRLSSQGFELAAAVLGFAGVGYWIGGYYGKQEMGLTIGAVLGIFGGLYNLIRASLREVDRQTRSRQDNGTP